jgi:hypothetical protein
VNHVWNLMEVKRISILEQLINGQITLNEAALSLGISSRQVLRLKKRLIKSGPEGVRHGNKGRVPKNKLSEEKTKKVLEVFLDWKCQTDEGVNASHLADILLRDHSVNLSRQTSWRLLRSRAMLINTRRVRKYRKKRDRREQMGDLLFLDGSPHRWMGVNHPRITLVLCTDDATTQALGGIFCAEEDRNSCFAVVHEVFTKFGLPRSFWLDRASQFITTRGEGVHFKQTAKPTHWQNAMYNLGIRNIFAHSPQARGRGERINGTFQERLCAELQYRKITELKDANQFLKDTFIPEYNKRFARDPINPTGLWRKPPDLDLRTILCRRNERKVLNDNTVKHDGRRFQLARSATNGSLAGKKVEAQDWFDGTVHVIVETIEGPKDWLITEVYDENPYKKKSGITEHYHHSTLFTHTYF